MIWNMEGEEVDVGDPSTAEQSQPLILRTLNSAENLCIDYYSV